MSSFCSVSFRFLDGCLVLTAYPTHNTYLFFSFLLFIRFVFGASRVRVLLLLYFGATIVCVICFSCCWILHNIFCWSRLRFLLSDLVRGPYLDRVWLCEYLRCCTFRGLLLLLFCASEFFPMHVFVCFLFFSSRSGLLFSWIKSKAHSFLFTFLSLLSRLFSILSVCVFLEFAMANNMRFTS